MKFYKCDKCGKIVSLIKDAPTETVCCGEEMKELKAGVSDGAVEKHVPVYSFEKGVLWVRVGSIEHPMSEEHHIAWIALETKTGYQLKYLKHCCYPEVQFALIPHDEVVSVYAYCNQHGLWCFRQNSCPSTSSSANAA